MSLERFPTRGRPVPALSTQILVPIALAAAVAALALGSGFSEAGKRTGHAQSWGYSYGNDRDDDRFAYALVEGEDASVVMTNGDDWDEIEDLKRDSDEPLLWFRIDRARYLVRDDRLIARATEALRPMRELGKKQGKLGAEQGRLGTQQGRLGAEQGRYGARQAELSGDLQLVVMRMLRAERRRESTRALERERDEIEREIEELSTRQREFGRQQGELGAVQGRLGAQQGELGRQQRDAAARARDVLREIADDAIARGLAERL